MLGNFSFGGDDYEQSVEMWHCILQDLGLSGLSVQVHPTQEVHRQMWERRGYGVVDDPECVWSDGKVGGYCCEIYIGGLEIGNLVNPLKHSTDVGFGWERLLQVVSGVDRVDRTELFDQTLPPVVRDHYRTLLTLRQNNSVPGNKQRGYVCRRLLRRVLLTGITSLPGLEDWCGVEMSLRERNLKTGRRLWRRHEGKPTEWWWDTCGLTPDEVTMLRE
jgi:alanyl-tRNA synthetase